MKQLFTAALFIAMMLILVAPSQSRAAAGDTLLVYATPITVTLDSVIAQDQRLATPHPVYKLVSTDTPYVFNKTIVINNSVTIIGQLGTQNRPPCIQPNVITGAVTVPGHLFTFTKGRSVVNIKNLYLLGLSVNNTINSGDGFGITVTGDSIKCHIDNVVFEQWSQFGINYSGNWDSFWVTNCKFRNFVNPGSCYTGEAIRFRNDLGHFPTDTMLVKYNTFFCLNGYVCAAGITSYMRYFDFEHNTVAGVFKNPFFNMNATNWTCSHNIFYAAYAGGMSNGEYPWWDRIWAPGVGAVIDLDTLSKAIAGSVVDTTQANWIALGEAARNIQVKDNVYYMPASITSAIDTWNADTIHNHNWIYKCGWTNPYTDTMVAHNSHFSLTGNQNVDLGFGAGVTTMIAASGTPPAADGIGFIPWLKEFRGADVATHLWGYQQAIPDFSSGNWKPTWPLPEQTANDLKYSSTALATDGMRYGDPFWFTGTRTGVVKGSDLTPTTFSLSEAYPNPFNPATHIQYTLNKAGVTSLTVYNILGQTVATLVDNVNQNAGTYNVTVDMSHATSGVYFYLLEQGGNRLAHKMLLLK